MTSLSEIDTLTLDTTTEGVSRYASLLQVSENDTNYYKRTTKELPPTTLSDHEEKLKDEWSNC